MTQRSKLLPTMANPTSAFFSAGPSLVPSPVTATTSRLGLSLLSMMPLTSVYLSCGDERANTRRRGQILSISSCFAWPQTSTRDDTKRGRPLYYWAHTTLSYHHYFQPKVYFCIAWRILKVYFHYTAAHCVVLRAMVNATKTPIVLLYLSAQR